MALNFESKIFKKGDIIDSNELNRLEQALANYSDTAIETNGIVSISSIQNLTEDQQQQARSNAGLDYDLLNTIDQPIIPASTDESAILASMSTDYQEIVAQNFSDSSQIGSYLASTKDALIDNKIFIKKINSSVKSQALEQFQNECKNYFLDSEDYQGAKKSNIYAISNVIKQFYPQSIPLNIKLSSNYDKPNIASVLNCEAANTSSSAYNVLSYLITNAGNFLSDKSTNPDTHIYANTVQDYSNNLLNRYVSLSGDIMSGSLFLTNTLNITVNTTIGTTPSSAVYSNIVFMDNNSSYSVDETAHGFGQISNGIDASGNTFLSFYTRVNNSSSSAHTCLRLLVPNTQTTTYKVQVPNTNGTCALLTTDNSIGIHKTASQSNLSKSYSANTILTKIQITKGYQVVTASVKAKQKANTDYDVKGLVGVFMSDIDTSSTTASASFSLGKPERQINLGNSGTQQVKMGGVFRATGDKQLNLQVGVALNKNPDGDTPNITVNAYKIDAYKIANY